MAILIAGCGYLGCATARLLLANGESVIGLRRRADDLPSGTIALAEDLLSPDLSDRLASVALSHPIEAIVFAASAGSHDRGAYESVYIDGLANILRAASQLALPPKRIIYVSSTSVYGDSDGQFVNEQSPTQPSSFAGDVLLRAEQLVRQANIPSVVLRFAGIYGPGRWRLPQSVLDGTARLVPGGGPITNRIHRDDGAAAIVHVLGLVNPSPLYVVVDEAPTSQNEVLNWLAKRSNREILWASGNDSLSSPRHRGSKYCSGALLRASGFQCRYPSYQEGYEEFFTHQSR